MGASPLRLLPWRSSNSWGFATAICPICVSPTFLIPHKLFALLFRNSSGRRLRQISCVRHMQKLRFCFQLSHNPHIQLKLEFLELFGPSILRDVEFLLSTSHLISSNRPNRYHFAYMSYRLSQHSVNDFPLPYRPVISGIREEG